MKKRIAKKKTITVTLSYDTEALLQKVVDHYGTLSNPTGICNAALEVGLGVYCKQLGIDLPDRFKPFVPHVRVSAES